MVRRRTTKLKMSKADIKPPDDDELLQAIALVTGVSHARAEAMVNRVHNQDGGLTTGGYNGWDYKRLGRRRLQWILRAARLSDVMFHENNMPKWDASEPEIERLRNMSYVELLQELDTLEAMGVAA